MQPLQCAECKAQVLVQKNSWEHTAVQWNDQARARCIEIADEREFGRREGRPGSPRKQCGALTASIIAAAKAGDIEIFDETPVPKPIIDDNEPVPAPFH
ncbi:hypothetical protein [Rhodococcus sp. IEGM 1379]|uniref:hypothetical protein n=1 Tax=Rhodococcus sp. IEGM 1379 TaxID=3047086 RepID=UPI0024B6A299|nr:hypothetical protein [Rhodococcus sp. IEGM 1379]MDI9918587.1 hypothetical protein [Rhodococcus sp. IEGM 1379]